MKFFKRHFKKTVAVALCLTVLLCVTPASAQTQPLPYTSLYNEEKVSSEIFANNGKYTETYPNGIINFPIASAELEMEEMYCIDLYRLGGTSGSAEITLETVDYTAGYGIDYEVYLNNDYDSKPVQGEASLLYAMEEFSFIPTVTSSDSENVDDTETNANEIISGLSSSIQDLITPSSSFVIKFADGENHKQLFIKTLKDDTVTADLEFIIRASKADGCTKGTQSYVNFTIKEEREKPETQLKISDLKVNPESEQAYVIVSRGGNTGTYGSYRVVTKSDTAVAGEDYEPVQMQLDFIPGMSEQKIPITILDNAKSGKQFKVLIENAKNATVIDGTATITFDSGVTVESLHETALTLASSAQKLKRGVEYVPISNFQKQTATSRGKGKKKSSFTLSSNYGTLYYSNGIASKNNAISIRTKNKINFTGVDKLSMTIDNLTDSCAWDHNAIYVSDNDKFNSSTGNYDWLSSLAKSGAVVGDYWSMGNTANDHSVRMTPSLTPSKVNGEHYLYIMLHKGGFSGNASFKIFSKGSNSTDNVLLHLTKYNLSILNPDNVQIYKDGVLTNVAPATNLLVSNPETGKYNKSTDIYRNESVNISGAADAAFDGNLTLKGIVFCNSSNTSKTSELISLNSNKFTLTTDLIQKYSSYFSNNNIVIKPVYSVDTANVTVSGYNGTHKVDVNTSSCSAEVTYKNQKIGTLNWTKSERSKGSYLVGDELKFTFKPSVDLEAVRISLDIKTANSSGALSSATTTTLRSTNETITTSITDDFISITPYLSYADTGLMLNVKNPSYGDFSGKNSTYSTTASDDSVYIRGYQLSNGTKVDFNSLSVGSVLSLYATPRNGYRAKWTYTDSITSKQKVYYGNSFFFAIQYSLGKDENNITLSFEKVSNLKDYYFNGTVSIQEGSVLSPADSTTDIYNVLSNASLTIGSYMALSDEFGEFSVTTEATSANSEKAVYKFVGDETIRALVMANNQYYIADIDIGECSLSNSSQQLTADLKLDYQSFGPTPKSITATDSENTLYGDTIPLVSTKAIQFDLKLDLQNQDSSKPINMIKWTAESDDGVSFEEEKTMENGVSSSKFSTIVSEVFRPGMKLYVELFNISTDQNGNNIYTTYGKFDTGYNFIALSDAESVTYAPDIGVSSTLALPAPCIGPINPTFSLAGFSPIINSQSNGTDSEGHEIKTISIGISFSKLKNYAKRDSKYETASLKKKIELLKDTLNSLSNYINNIGNEPAFALGAKLTNALNLKTSVKVSLSLAVCFQANYYVDDLSGDWMFVSRIIIAGFGGTLNISVPFTFFYIPCFTYLTVSLNANVFMVIQANEDETGTSPALKIGQLFDPDLSYLQGVYEIKGTLTFGLGVGFDGLVAASGSVATTLDIQFSDFENGIGKLSMSGGITLEFLIFKYSWSESIFKLKIFDTTDSEESVLQSIQSEFEQDLLNKVKLKDMMIETSSDENTVLRSAVSDNKENILANSNSPISPSIIKLDDERYMIATIVSKKNADESQKHKLYYVIYNEKTGEITENDFVLNKYLNDLNSRSGLRSAVGEQIDYLDSSVQLTDCGDDILISWTKLNTKIGENTDNLNILKSIGIANLYYNKESGKFHDYSMTVSEDKNIIYINPKVAYNENTGVIQLFYEKMDLSGVSLESTLAQLQQCPTTLASRYTLSDGDLNDWSQETQIALSDNALNYYDVESVGDKNILAFVSSDKKGFTLEGVSDYDYDETFDSQDFDTVNSMYIQQFELKGNSLEGSKQIKITGDDYVTANPEFARIKSGEMDNLLLFYKCNGLYAYQNINTILTYGVYTDQNGNKQIHEDYLEPQFITTDEDHTINDDFKIVSDENNIYALWTTTEGTQQQIWARSFCFDGVDKVEESPILDSEGNMLYEENGEPKTEKLDQPIYLLKGHWGGKTYLTEGGLNNTETGKYKKYFDATVTDDGNLLTIFNAFDLNYENDGISVENNKVVIAKYKTDSEYEVEDSFSEVTFSDDYPTSGETVKVYSTFTNTGILNGKNTKAQLFVNGELYAENDYESWITSESKQVEFDYILPENADFENIEMFVRIVENGETKAQTKSYSLNFGDNLSIENLSLLPIKNIDENNNSCAYRVIATVKNNGNKDYSSGKYLRIAEMDLGNLADSLNENSDNSNNTVYSIYGTKEIEEIKVGEVKTFSFVTEDIPKAVFEKSSGKNTAYLEGIITDSTQIDKTIFKADDEITVLDEFYSGLTEIAEYKPVEKISLSDLTLNVGKVGKLQKEISPKSATANLSIEYTSSDESIATVDNLGVVTALKEGKCVITAKSGSVVAKASVSVKGTAEEDSSVTKTETSVPKTKSNEKTTVATKQQNKTTVSENNDKFDNNTVENGQTKPENSRENENTETTEITESLTENVNSDNTENETDNTSENSKFNIWNIIYLILLIAVLTALVLFFLKKNKRK